MAVPGGSVIISKKWISQKFSGFENLSYVGDITGSEVVRAPVISWLNSNWATHSNSHILRVVLSVWSDTTGER